jgi:hypothetical protein
MELKVVLFDRLSVVVAVDALRLSTLESLLMAFRMPGVSSGGSSIVVEVCVAATAECVQAFASKSRRCETQR